MSGLYVYQFTEQLDSLLRLRHVAGENYARNYRVAQDDAKCGHGTYVMLSLQIEYHNSVDSSVTCRLGDTQNIWDQVKQGIWVSIPFWRCIMVQVEVIITSHCNEPLYVVHILHACCS